MKNLISLCLKTFKNQPNGGIKEKYISIIVAALFILFTFISIPATFAIDYTIVDLGPSYIGPVVINDFGQVAFTSANNNNHATLWSAGVSTDLGTLSGGSESVAYGINNKGQVAGGSTGSWGGVFHPFLFADGKMIDLGTLGGSEGSALGINDHGDVVGQLGFLTTVGNEYRALHFAFLYKAGSMINLGTLPGGNSSSAQAINNAGQIASYSNADFYSTSGYATIYQAGNFTNLGSLWGSSWASDINNSGQVVGYTGTGPDTGNHAFLYTGGNMVDLGTLPGNKYSDAYAINDKGAVVGMSVSAVGIGSAFLYTGGKMIDLNNTIPVGSNWHLEIADDINNKGQIVGDGYLSSDSHSHAFILTPLTVNAPIPTSVPNIMQFPKTENLFIDSATFIKSYNGEFSAPSQAFLIDNLDPLDKFLIKTIGGPNWKERFSNLERASRAIGAGLSILSIPVSMIENPAAGIVKGLAALALWEGGTYFKSTYLGDDIAARGIIDSMSLLINTPTGGISLALTISGMLTSDFIAPEFAELAHDPPDPNYKEVFQSKTPLGGPFKIPGISADLNNLLGQVFNSLYSTYYYLTGLTTSIDRYGSALNAGDAISAGLQFEAFIKYLSLYDSSAIETASLINQLKQAMVNYGIQDLAYDPNIILELQNQLRTNGLPNELYSDFISIGLSPSDIENLIQSMLNFTPPETLPGTLYSNITDTSNLFLYGSSAPQTESTPEPATFILIGSGLIGIIGLRKKFKN